MLQFYKPHFLHSVNWASSQSACDIDALGLLMLHSFLILQFFFSSIDFYFKVFYWSKNVAVKFNIPTRKSLVETSW